MEAVDSFPGYTDEFWDQVFDGRVQKLTRGDDFTPQARDFKQTVKENARKRGIEVQLKKEGEHTLYVQNVGRIPVPGGHSL